MRHKTQSINILYIFPRMNWFRNDYPLYTYPVVDEKFRKYQNFWIIIGPRNDVGQWPSLHINRHGGIYKCYYVFDGKEIILDESNTPYNVWKKAVEIRSQLMAGVSASELIPASELMADASASGLGSAMSGMFKTLVAKDK